MKRRLTKRQQRMDRVRELLKGESDDVLAGLEAELRDLCLAALKRFEQEKGKSPGEHAVRRLCHHGKGKDVLRLPVRGRQVRDWLPPSYDDHVQCLQHQLYVKQLSARLSELGDIPLDAKLLIGKEWYEECKAEEAWDSNDDTRVATLLMEAQLDMLEGRLFSGTKPPANRARAERIEALIGIFDMMA